MSITRIALLLPDLEAGGAQRMLLTLAAEFIHRGYPVDLLVVLRRGALCDAIPEGVTVEYFNTQIPRGGAVMLALCTILRLRRWLSRHHPTAVLSSVTGANLIALLCRGRRDANTRLIIREAATLANVRNPLRLWLMRRLYPRANAVVALTEVMADQLRERIGVPAPKVVCIPNTPDVNRIRQLASQPLQHPLLDDDETVAKIVAVGRLVPQKDYPLLLRAMTLLQQSRPARLFIVGEGPERAALEEQIRDLKLETDVVLIGYESNPWRWMRRADLYVLSSNWEGHPNALLEALALGIPTVATEHDTSIARMAATYGFACVPANKPEALAQGMLEQLQNPKNPFGPGHGDLNTVVQKYLSVLAPN